MGLPVEQRGAVEAIEAPDDDSRRLNREEDCDRGPDRFGPDGDMVVAKRPGDAAAGVLDAPVRVHPPRDAGLVVHLFGRREPRRHVADLAMHFGREVGMRCAGVRQRRAGQSDHRPAGVGRPEATRRPVPMPPTRSVPGWSKTVHTRPSFERSIGTASWFRRAFSTLGVLKVLALLVPPRRLRFRSVEAT